MDPRPAADHTSRPQPPPPGLRGLAALVLDLDGRITGSSPPAGQLFNRLAGDIVGADIRHLVGHRAAAAVDRALAAAAAGRPWSGVLAVDPPNRHLSEVEFRWQPVMDAVGQPSAIVVTPSAPPAPGGRADFSLEATADGLALLNQASQRIGSTLNLSRTAQEVIDVAVPRLADGAGVYVLEELLADEEFPRGEPDGTVVARRLAIGVTDGDTADWAAMFPADEVIVVSPDTPFARCIADREPIHFTLPDRRGADLRYPWEGTFAEKLLREAAFVALPLRARGQTLGVVVFARIRGHRGFAVHDVAVAVELAARAAVSIDNARLYRRERRTALALQESLLATDPTVPPGIEIAYRCLPASDTTHVGGDWYDVIPLPGGRIALVVGDAMGHGVTAAAAMGHLRTAVRTLASLDLPPADVLDRLDQMAQGLRNAQFATCIYAVCDPGDQTCTIACAGHVPPILAHPDGATTIIAPPPGLPLGVGGTRGAFHAIQTHIPDGAVLALYTDGLVENRKRDLDTGTAALRTALANTHDTLEATCETLITALHPPLDQDDVTLLLARIHTDPARNRQR